MFISLNSLRQPFIILPSSRGSSLQFSKTCYRITLIWPCSVRRARRSGWYGLINVVRLLSYPPIYLVMPSSFRSTLQLADIALVTIRAALSYINTTVHVYSVYQASDLTPGIFRIILTFYITDNFILLLLLNVLNAMFLLKRWQTTDNEHKYLLKYNSKTNL